MKEFIKNNSWVWYPICVLIGIAIAYFTFQTKITIKDQEIKTLTQTNQSLSGKIETLTTQNSHLKQQISQQQHTVTITYPDGSSVTTVDTNTQTITDLTTSIETKLRQEYSQLYEQFKTEWAKTHEQEIINPKTITTMLVGGVGPRTLSVDFLLKAKMFGPVGAVGGFGMAWDKETPLGLPASWNRPNFVGKAGISYDF